MVTDFTEAGTRPGASHDYILKKKMCSYFMVERMTTLGITALDKTGT